MAECKRSGNTFKLVDGCEYGVGYASDEARGADAAIDMGLAGLGGKCGIVAVDGGWADVVVKHKSVEANE
jgi:hypothetical protein